MWRPKLAGLIGLAVALLVPNTAGAAITIGSNLGRAPDGIMSSEGCSPPCTLMQDTLAPDRQAAGGLTSPVNGTVVLWRLRAGDSTAPTSLRVITRLANGLATGAGTSATVTPVPDTQSAFGTSLPIRIGQSIGITCCQPVAEYFIGSGGTRLLFTNFVDGGPGRMGSGTSPKEIALNADIEPTSSIIGASAHSKKRGKLRVTATVPNPGAFSARGKFLKPTTATVSAPGSASLTVKPVKKALARLAGKRKLKTTVQLAFTPTGGATTTVAVRAKLRS
jgi:hypothetical protein